MVAGHPVTFVTTSQRERRSTSAMLLGSVSNAVVHAVRMPVIVARPT
jgi:nucleotide-binding universal stress UspA family protein